MLRPGGRIAGYTIHTRGGLTQTEEARASRLGPAEVNGSPPAELALAVGFSLVAVEDQTDAYEAACEALLRARMELEGTLRAAEGDSAYEDAVSDRKGMLQGIAEGLLHRSLIVAVKE